jgi:ribonuclease J
MANAKLALSTGVGLNHMNVFVIDNGMQIVFDGVKRPQILSLEAANINISPLLVDGRGVANIGANIIEERKKLSFDGAVVVAAVVSLSQKKIVAGPDCQMRGFVYVKEAEPLLKTITNIFLDEINTAIRNSDNPDFEKVKTAISDRARKFTKRENGREPYIVPIITAIE